LVECQLEIVAIAQRSTVGRCEQVAWSDSACRGRTLGIDVTDEEARDRGQADRSPLLERDRGIVDHEAKVRGETVVWTRALERVEELAQQLAELVALGLAKARENLVRVGEVLGSACLKQLSTTICERH
jgi:hypothetical protein